MTTTALKQPDFAEQYIGRDGTVEGEAFGTAFVAALRGGYEELCFDGLRQIVAENPAATVSLLQSGMEYASTAKGMLVNQNTFKSLISLSARAINHIQAPAEKAAAASTLMDSLSPFIDGQGSRVFSIAQLYVTVPEGHYPLTALNTLARNYATLEQSVADFAVAEARDYVKNGGDVHARAAGDTLTRFAKPNSADFALGVQAVVRPVEAGESVCDVLDMQATALARATDSAATHALLAAIEKTMQTNQNGPVVYTYPAMAIQVLLSADKSGATPTPLVEESIMGMMVAAYFSSSESERDTILTGFSVIEDVHMQERPNTDFGRTMIGMAGTRIAMIEHGIDRDSMYVAHLHEKGIALPAPKGAQ